MKSLSGSRAPRADCVHRRLPEPDRSRLQDAACPALAVEKLSVIHRGALEPSVEDVTFTVANGSLTAIVGPNGAGKSTLVEAIVGLLPTASGTVRLAGGSLRDARGSLSYVPQKERVDWDFPVAVRDVVAMGLYHETGFIRRLRPEQRDRVSSALERVGMEEFANRPIGRLSGGRSSAYFLPALLWRMRCCTYWTNR